MNMDVNELHSLYTVLAFVSFAGIVLWAYSGKRKADFEEAGRLPMTEEDSPDTVDRRNGEI